jgi:hypothetical protein
MWLTLHNTMVTTCTACSNIRTISSRKKQSPTSLWHWRNRKRKYEYYGGYTDRQTARWSRKPSFHFQTKSPRKKRLLSFIRHGPHRKWKGDTQTAMWPHKPINKSFFFGGGREQDYLVSLKNLGDTQMDRQTRTHRQQSYLISLPLFFFSKYGN